MPCRFDVESHPLETLRGEEEQIVAVEAWARAGGVKATPPG